MKSSQITHPEATLCTLKSYHILSAKCMLPDHFSPPPSPPQFRPPWPYFPWITAMLPNRCPCFTSTPPGSVLNTTATIIFSGLKKVTSSFCLNPCNGSSFHTEQKPESSQLPTGPCRTWLPASVWTSSKCSSPAPVTPSSLQNRPDIRPLMVPSNWDAVCHNFVAITPLPPSQLSPSK